MKMHSKLQFLALSLVIITAPLAASFWTSWTEYPTDPIYDPYPSQTLPEDFFPCVVFDDKQFKGHGDQVSYKMWHQGADTNGSIGLSYSNDGVIWTLKGETNIPTPAYHPCILYDKNGFGGGSYQYKMWYWTGSVGTTPDVIQYAQSNDGLTWTTTQAITQDLGSPIVFGPSGTYFYHLYGPGFMIHNPAATSVPGQPFTFPYVMFYDIASETPIPSSEGIGLAYSSDGLNWTRYGTVPVLLSNGGTDWDGTHTFRPSIINVKDTYHMFYSGSNDNIDPTTTVYYAHGLGHATSTDGINWTKDTDNPIFIYSDGVPWRNSRSYTPFVLFGRFKTPVEQPDCSVKMWFVGGIGLVAGQNQAIGYATLPCPTFLDRKQ